MKFAALLLPLLFAIPARAQKFYTYLLDLGPDYVEVAWGTADGVNTIGRSSVSYGPATIHVAGKTIASVPNYVTVGGLEPDHDYTYDISIGPTKIGASEFRTWPAQTSKLVFFVIGDYGTGREPQFSVARAMWEEFQRREKTGNPVRFMLSVGDNIYGNINTFLIGISHTGAEDRDWGPKFFGPYEPLLARIPFFGTLGNHDGNETESHRDLPAFLDNFPFPGGKPGRYYAFNFGGLAKFVALDSTKNTESGPQRPFYLEDGVQFQWMKKEFAKPHPGWIIPYYHHPIFNAGPFHPPALHDLQHWLDLFGASGVKVAFSGHEHNFQVSEANALSHGIRFVVSGAGGELRPGSVQSVMKQANIALWAPQNHFLVVEIDGKTMTIRPISFVPMQVHDANGGIGKLPVVVQLP
jgi:hypothetical protein